MRFILSSQIINAMRPMKPGLKCLHRAYDFIYSSKAIIRDTEITNIHASPYVDMPLIIPKVYDLTFLEKYKVMLTLYTVEEIIPLLLEDPNIEVLRDSNPPLATLLVLPK